MNKFADERVSFIYGKKGDGVFAFKAEPVCGDGLPTGGAKVVLGCDYVIFTTFTKWLPDTSAAPTRVGSDEV